MNVKIEIDAFPVRKEKMNENTNEKNNGDKLLLSGTLFTNQKERPMNEVVN